jgi:uncharacterized protein YyaL (SSP411 family)
MHERAVETYAAMQSRRFFYQPSSGLYHELHPYEPLVDQPNGYLWSFEEATTATLALYGIADASGTYASALEDRLKARENYWDGRGSGRAYRSYPKTGDRYYDDNCWSASNLLQHHVLTGSASGSIALQRAEGVFDYIRAAWTTDLPNPGGVRWIDSPSNGDRAANSTAGFAKLGAVLYEITGRPAYLETARRAYDWIQQHLRAANGLYANAMRVDEQLDRKQWIYNQGIVIGAAVLLHRVTGAPDYIDEAIRLADATFAVFGADPYYSGADGAYDGRAIFNAIFFRNLLMLHAVTDATSYLERMRAYADAVWSDPKLHDPKTNLFRLHGGKRHSLLDQAAMVQVFALLSWRPASYARLI